MNARHNSRVVILRTVGVLFLTWMSLSACDSQPGSSVDEDIETLRNATDAFTSVEAAHDAGYEVLVTHPQSGDSCLFDPGAGGMGAHYLKASLADSTVAVASPEVLIYEPQANGSLEFVAVEYIIPFAIRPESEAPPRLFGKAFKRNHTFNVWALHVWSEKDNPGGTFIDYNPDVTCDYAGENP